MIWIIMSTACQHAPQPMNPAITPKHVSQTYERAFRDSSELELSFECARNYNREFEFTLHRTCREIAELGEGLRVLEVGAFTGVVSSTLARLGYRVSATDVPFVADDPALRRFLETENVGLHAVDLTKDRIPHPDGSFDVIIFHSVLAHLNVNPIPVVREFHRLLSDGGAVYCNTPNLLAAKNVWRMVSGRGYLDPIGHLEGNLNEGTGLSVGLHWREWTKAELIDLFGCCGFDLEHHRFAVTTPNRSGLPRKQLVRLLYSLRPAFMPTQIGIFRKRPVSAA